MMQIFTLNRVFSRVMDEVSLDRGKSADLEGICWYIVRFNVT